MSSDEPNVEPRNTVAREDSAIGLLLPIGRSLAILFGWIATLFLLAGGSCIPRVHFITYVIAWIAVVGSVVALVFNFRRRHRTRPSEYRLVFYLVTCFWGVHYICLNGIGSGHSGFSVTQHAFSVVAVCVMFALLFGEEIGRWFAAARKIDPATGQYRTRTASTGKAHVMSLFTVGCYVWPIPIILRSMHGNPSSMHSFSRNLAGFLFALLFGLMITLASKKHRAEAPSVISLVALVLLQFLQARFQFFPNWAFVTLSLMLLAISYLLLVRSNKRPRTPPPPNWATKKWTWSWRTGFREMK